MNSDSKNNNSRGMSFRQRTHEIIFEADTTYGLAFDVLLLAAIALSVAVVCLETVDSYEQSYGRLLIRLEWFLTILFTIEYGLRLYCVQRPMKYATSFFGVVDLLAVLPTYLGLLFLNSPSLAVVRAFRLLRVFRIFKLLWFMREADELGRALKKAQAKIIVFLGVVVVSITVAGTLMYEIENWGSAAEVSFTSEGERNTTINDLRIELTTSLDAGEFGDAERALKSLREIENLKLESKFTSIPESMYWATVTMTTVGYGDIVPTTTLGKFVAAILILLGYSLIIVPTGFVSAEFIEARKSVSVSTQACPYCMLENHDVDAVYCKRCGKPIQDFG